MIEHEGRKALNEIMLGIDGVTPGPWKTGRLQNQALDHVIDFGPPPSAPFMVLRDGSPPGPHFTGIPPSGISHSDDGSHAVNAAHIARCSPEAFHAIAALVEEQDAKIKLLREALVRIRGWREIGKAITLDDFLRAIEEIADKALEEKPPI